jgi:polyhydroxyalkanoate synthase
MVQLAQDEVAKLQANYFERMQALLEAAAKGQPPELKDKRFSDASWSHQLYGWNASLYLLNAEFLQRMADAVISDEKTKERIRFATQQWVEALSPANFLVSNPEAQQRLLQTNGQSLVDGMNNLMADLQKGKLSQTDDAAFEVGRNVARSQGNVVFENELIQLIQYKPSTAQVGARPLLMVPPCINKFYILDLQPENSFVAHAVEQGITVFMVSWRNVGADQGHLTWDDYLQLGVVDAIEAVQSISGSDTINTLGFCVGGTILSAALAVLAARGQRPASSLTLMTTLLDFEQPGTLGIFVDEQHVQLREQMLGQGGVLAGKELATTFSFLRPTDLVWNYVVNNYLKGEKPPAFDLLYWNGDSTNLPGPMYAWYLRHMYLQNELRIPGRLRCLGEAIDLGAINVPTYVFAAKEDHIVPWHAAYASTQLLKGPMRFALGASGHIAGTINPASKNKRSFWLGATMPSSPQQWLDQAKEHPGSWWTDWRAWIKPHLGPMKPAPRKPGNAKHPALEPAPGRYVKQPAP